MNVVKQFLQRLEQVADLPAPTVCLEPDSSVGLDWDIDRRHTLSVAIGDDGGIGWASLMGAVSTHGTCHVGEPWPVEFVDALRAVETCNRHLAGSM